MAGKNGPSGIPTLYQGVQYRSRLEAKWAAFFDLLGWHHQYEPFDLDGWIPDFLLPDAVARPLLVEIKPVIEFPDRVATRVEPFRESNDILILGCMPVSGTQDSLLQVGWIGPLDLDGWYRASLMVIPVPEDRPGEPNGAARIIIPDRCSFPPPGWSPEVWSGFTDLMGREFTERWNRAGNLVQWRGHRSEAT